MKDLIQCTCGWTGTEDELSNGLCPTCKMSNLTYADGDTYYPDYYDSYSPFDNAYSSAEDALYSQEDLHADELALTGEAFAEPFDLSAV